jgi:hypothetical protein
MNGVFAQIMATPYPGLLAHYVCVLGTTNAYTWWSYKYQCRIDPLTKHYFRPSLNLLVTNAVILPTMFRASIPMPVYLAYLMYSVSAALFYDVVDEPFKIAEKVRLKKATLCTTNPTSEI